MTYDSIYTDTITVYNRYATSFFQPPLPPVGAVKYDRTVIKGCEYKDDVHTYANSEGKSFIDKTVTVTIPIESAKKSGKKYVDPQTYASRITLDDSTVWTVRTDENNPDVIVFGEGPEITDLYTIDKLRREYKHCFPIQVSDTSKDREEPGWKIKGV
jgi:hypothetical protein